MAQLCEKADEPGNRAGNDPPQGAEDDVVAQVVDDVENRRAQISRVFAALYFLVLRKLLE